MIKLFLDNSRDPPDASWRVAKSYFEVVGIVTIEDLYNIHQVSFDFNLSERDSVHNGYHVASWLVNQDLHARKKNVKRKLFNSQFSFSIHSASDKGARMIRRVLNNHFERFGETETREIIR